MGRLIAIVLAAGGLLGCATVTKGTDQLVFIDTPGYAGANCKLTSKGIGGYRQIVTPANIELPKSRRDIAVQCTHPCGTGSGMIPSNLEGMTAGNLLVGGVIGLGVDAASGAMNKYSAMNQIVMTPNGKC
jgi:hypothetical protein